MLQRQRQISDLEPETAEMEFLSAQYTVTRGPGYVKLIDFGIAKRLDEDRQNFVGPGARWKGRHCKAVRRSVLAPSRCRVRMAVLSHALAAHTTWPPRLGVIGLFL